MPADPVSRYVEDFGCDSDKSAIKAKQIFEELEARDHLMEPYGRPVTWYGRHPPFLRTVPYGRVNGLISPEERQSRNEELKKRWEEVLCGIVGGGG